MRYRLPATAMCLALLLAAQKETPPRFEAASVKRSDAAPGSGSGVNTTPGRLHAYNATLRRCIRGAYGVSEVLIFGGPKWVDEDRFDIVATDPAGGGDARLSAMLQTLLAERFGLVVHRETRMIPGYALTLAKSGLKLKASLPGAPARTDSGRGRLYAQGCTLPYFAMRLSTSLGIPVQNATGLEGAYDIALDWQPGEAQPAGTDAKPSIFEAIQEQAGLRLENRKLPVETIVIDHAELPTEN